MECVCIMYVCSGLRSSTECWIQPSGLKIRTARTSRVGHIRIDNSRMMMCHYMVMEHARVMLDKQGIIPCLCDSMMISHCCCAGKTFCNVKVKNFHKVKDTYVVKVSCFYKYIIKYIILIIRN